MQLPPAALLKMSALRRVTVGARLLVNRRVPPIVGHPVAAALSQSEPIMELGVERADVELCRRVTRDRECPRERGRDRRNEPD